MLVGAGFGTSPDHLRLTTQDRRGRRHTVSILARLDPPRGEAASGTPMLLDAAQMLPAERRPLYLREPERPFRIAFPDGRDLAFVQLKATRGLGADAFLAEALIQLEARRPRDIVIDLRFNLGGDLNLTRDFMRALPEIASGRVYAITSGRTFSAAISSLGYLRQAAGDRLVIVGEPIGDRLEFWAEGNLITLPGLGAASSSARAAQLYTGCPRRIPRFDPRHPIQVKACSPICRRAALRRFRRRARSGDGGNPRRYRA